MDPFSITVGAFGLLEATTSIVKLAKAAKNADKKIEPLHAALSNLAHVVSSVKALFSNNEDLLVTRPFPVHIAALAGDLEEAQRKIEEADCLIRQKLHRPRDDGSDEEQEGSTKCKVKRASVVKRLSKIERLVSELNSLNSRLRADITLHETFILQAVQATLEVVEDEVLRTHDHVKLDVEQLARQVQELPDAVGARSLLDLNARSTAIIGTVEEGVKTITDEMAARDIKSDIEGLGKQIASLRDVMAALYSEAVNIKTKRLAQALNRLFEKSLEAQPKTKGRGPAWPVAGSKACDRRHDRRHWKVQKKKIQESFALWDDAPLGEESDGGRSWTTTSSATVSRFSVVMLSDAEVMERCSPLKIGFERSPHWYPEQYTQRSKIPKFLAARFVVGVQGTGEEVNEWHVWWRESPRRWRFIRITDAEEEGEEKTSSLLQQHQQRIESSEKGKWNPEYIWTPPTQSLSVLPCSLDDLDRFTSDEGGLWEDVTNLRLSKRKDSATSMDEKPMLMRDDEKPYEPEDTYSKSSYRSSETLLEVRHLNCPTIPEREVIILEIISGFTAAVMVHGKKCTEKKLPLAPFHLEPFKYEMKALYLLRGHTGIIDFVGVEVDNQRQRLLGYIRDCEDLDLSSALDWGTKSGQRIPWSTRERWAGQIIMGVASAHAKDIVVGTLDANEIGVDDARNANLLHVGHGLPPLHSGCLAPEFRHRRDLSDDKMNSSQDVFALGLVLWLLAQTRLPSGVVLDPRTKGRKPWWKKLFCMRANCRYGKVALEDNRCREPHSDPVDLPPCGNKVSEWYESLIEKCRKTQPEHRLRARDLRIIFNQRASRPVSARKVSSSA